MTSWLSEKIIRGKISKEAEKHIEVPNPYYYYEENQLPNGQTQKKKIKRRIPLGISKNDEKILKSVRRTAWYMDLFFGFCGIRAGWAAVIGFIP
jgi:flagellar basal body-associated protein FliL